MEIKKVMVAGGGTLGSQIAWQIAFHGFKVTVYDAFENGLEKCKAFLKEYAELFISKRGATKQEIDDTLNRLSYTTYLQEAVYDADLLSESIPEIIKLKKKFYTDLGNIAPEKTIFTTNTSSTIPSLYADASGRPGKLLALHFANGIWDAVGLSTVYHALDGLATTLNDPIQRKRADWLKENFVDKGKIGRSTGEGFYTYPNPRFEEPDFLK